MNFDKSKVLLKKINAIHDGVADGGGSFSSLEKDLILEYVRDLYEIIRLDQPNSSAPIKEVKKEEPKPRVADTEVVDALPTIPPVQVPTPSSNGHATHAPSTNGHHPSPAVAQQPVATFRDVDPDMEELFAESKLNDISQRFANTPIQDIAKSMGINERILTINELFKGDQQHFQSTADTLNEYTSFAEAKAYLSKGPAAKYDWTNPKRKKKAATFIKLVRRRYL